MARTVKISEARAKLFDLVERVTNGTDSVVLIEHRDRKQRAALVSESHLSYLEAIAAAHRAAAGDQRFSLFGSIEWVGEREPEDVLAEMRQERSGHTVEKFTDV